MLLTLVRCRVPSTFIQSLSQGVAQLSHIFFFSYLLDFLIFVLTDLLHIMFWCICCLILKISTFVKFQCLISQPASICRMFSLIYLLASLKVIYSTWLFVRVQLVSISIISCVQTIVRMGRKRWLFIGETPNSLWIWWLFKGSVYPELGTSGPICC